MKILVINGSPKGKYSITLQTALYLEKLHPAHQWDVLHVGQQIRSLEKELTEWMAGDRQQLCPTLQRMADADLLLFCYPVYTFLVPAQLHRFIELVKESGIDLRGKAATQLLTSRHFFDITAMGFIEDNARDMGLHMYDAHSADMEALNTPKGQLEVRLWWQLLEWKMGGEQPVEANSGKTIALVADLAPDDDELRSLIDRFTEAIPHQVDFYNLRDFPFTGSCISCFRCTKDGRCALPDGFDTWLRETLQQGHDSIVYAFRVKDHSMGSLFKMYDDRQFCNGHRAQTIGKPQAYLIAGDFSNEANLRIVIEGRADMGGNWLAGIGTDEASVDTAARRLAWALEADFYRPMWFYGKGGMMIFRDLVWHMQGLMRADHRYFREHGLYDFPQKQWRQTVFTYLIGKMMTDPKLRKKLGTKIFDGMVREYKKTIDQAEPEDN